MRNSRVIGHRGVKGYEPENTMRSFKRAIAMGCEWIEFDVRVVEGIAVVIHDDTVERTSNGMGELRSIGLKAARALDFGKGEQLPLLSEVMDELRGECGLQIEIKGSDGEDVIAQAIKAQMQAGFSSDDILVSAFDHRLLARFKKHLPTVNLGALVYGVPFDLANTATALGCYSVHLNREYVTPELMQDIKARGLKCFVYTVNNRVEAEHLFAQGVDGVFSDVPDLLL